MHDEHVLECHPRLEQVMYINQMGTRLVRRIKDRGISCDLWARPIDDILTERMP